MSESRRLVILGHGGNASNNRSVQMYDEDELMGLLESGESFEAYGKIKTQPLRGYIIVRDNYVIGCTVYHDDDECEVEHSIYIDPKSSFYEVLAALDKAENIMEGKLERLISDGEKSFDIWWDDLTPEAQQRAVAFWGDDGPPSNCAPIAAIGRE